MKFLVTRALAIVILAGLAVPASAQYPSLGEARNFGVLGLSNGTVSINEATRLAGSVGYCSGVVSSTNQKVAQFIGGAYVHSTATFSYTPATFVPSLGIHYGSVETTLDAKLNQANADALAFSSTAASRPADYVLGALGDNDSRTINSVGPITVVSITSVNFKEDYLAFVGRPGMNDLFVVNVTGDFAWDTSEIRLTNIGPGNVIFNFPNASSIDIGKSGTIFYGTILAPLGTVIYHNPATFEGAIIAKYISLHSAFNLTHVPFGEAPVPVQNTTWSRIKAGF